jgi:hypothetical protein
MHLERHGCPSDRYVWPGPEVPLHCQALIDLMINSWRRLITYIELGMLLDGLVAKKYLPAHIY